MPSGFFFAGFLGNFFQFFCLGSFKRLGLFKFWQVASFWLGKTVAIFVLWVVASWFCSAVALALFFKVLLVCGFLGETSSSKNIITAKTENKIIKNHLTVLDRFILPVKVSAIEDVGSVEGFIEDMLVDVLSSGFLVSSGKLRFTRSE